MFKRILVPLDGSSFAELALRPALHLAQQTRGIVDLLRVPVYGDSGIPEISEYDLQWADRASTGARDQAAEYLRDIKRSRAREGVVLRTAVVEGDRCQTIVDTAIANRDELIIMTSHARTGLARMVFGSVAAEVMRQAPCPLLVMRGPQTFNHILLALDGSALAEKGLQPGLNLAAGLGSKVTLLRVCESGDASRAESLTYLENLLGPLPANGPEVSIATESGPVGPSILRHAGENSVDLIAMTTHGRSGLRRLLYGSVTESVAAGTGCAMLITRPS